MWHEGTVRNSLVSFYYSSMPLLLRHVPKVSFQSHCS
jgi:hypothetical protein